MRPGGASVARLLLAGAALIAGCGGVEETPRERPAAVGGAVSPAPPEVPGAVQELLDEGNAAFEAQDYDRALERYQAAASADSTVASAWFGVYMTYEALGQEDRARQVRMRVQELGAPMPGDPHTAPPDGGPPTLEAAGEEETGS